MNSVNQEYFDRGETFYTGKVNYLQAFPGNNRVRFLWYVNSDPRITRTVIYWNGVSGGVDSTVVAINRTQPGSIQAETELNLPESGYVFEFVTKDDNGNRSLAVERSVAIYGDKYIALLQNRDVVSVSVSKITWATVSSQEILYTIVQYTDYTDPDNPATRTLRVENEDTETELSGAKSGEPLSVTTSYLPANGIDIVDALPKIYTLQ
jgi:hypothetical protein